LNDKGIGFLEDRKAGLPCSVSTGVFFTWVNAAEVRKRYTACVCVVWFGVLLTL